ncbi:unnamed protein product [Malus baccata var. baccata]
MASSSGTKNEFRGPSRSFSRAMTRMPTRVLELPNEDESLDSIVVPPGLPSIAPIFRVADEIEKDNPRVAYLCRFHGFEKAHKMDPTSSGRGVRQFKTLLLNKLEKDEIVTKHQLARSDPQEIVKYYHQFYEKNIKDGEYTKKPEEMAKNCQIATVLYDVLMTVVPPNQIDKQTLKMAEDVKKKREQYVNYNILPLYTVGVKPAIMELPERPNQAAGGRRKPKTNFVEVRTFWHLYRSFDRMWIFLILAFQAMLIVAWSPSGSLTAFFDADVFRSVLSIFITYAFLNLLQATLDIILSWHCWKSLKFTQILRYLLKFAVAGVWAVVLPIGYSSSVQSPTGLLKFFSSWARDWRNQSFYNYAVALYLLPNILAAVLFFLPPLRRHLERSNWRIVTLFMWWAQASMSETNFLLPCGCRYIFLLCYFCLS